MDTSSLKKIKLALTFIGIIIISSGVQAYTQNTSVNAKVLRQEDSTAMSGAHVILEEVFSGKQNAGLTSPEGDFSFRNLRGQRYRLFISYLGYENYEKTISILPGFNNLSEIFMKSSASGLGEVEIVKSVPMMVVNEDTIEYSADAYKTALGATTEDLVAKMPGMEVSQGSVKAQGEDVKKVTVDGRPFFNDDPTLALRNFPAEIVEKIQIYEEQSEQAKFTGFDDGQSVKAMNIVTRRNMRNGQFGSFYAGYGEGNTYATGGNFTSFNGDSRLTLLGQSNNVNQQNFSMQDLLGSFRSRGSRGGGGGGGGGGRLGGGRPSGVNMSDFMIGKQDGISTTHAYGLNYSDNWGEKIKLTATYFFNYVENYNDELLFQEYLISSLEGQTYSEETKTDSRNYNHRLFFKIDYDINEKNKIIIRPTISYQDNSSGSDWFGMTSLDNSPLSTSLNNYNSERSGFNLSNNITLMHKFDKPKRTISLNVRNGANSNDGWNSLFSLNEYYKQESLFVDSIDQFSDSFTGGYNVTSRLSYTEPIGENSQLQINYSYTINFSDADQMTYNYNLNDLQYNLTDTLLSSNFENRYKTHEFGTSYRYNKEKLRFMAGLNYQYSSMDNVAFFPADLETDYSYTGILPNLMLNFEPVKNKNIRIMYRPRVNMPSVSQLQNVLNNNNPLQLSIGNPELGEERIHSIVLRYQSANTEKSSMFYTGMRFAATQNYIGNNIFIASADTIINNIELARASQLIQLENMSGYFNGSVFMTFGTPIPAIKSNLNTNLAVGLSKNPGIVNGEEGYSLDRNINLGLSLNSNISEFLDFSISTNSYFNDPVSSLASELESNYFYQKSRAKLKWVLPSSWFMEFNMDHSIYKGLSDGYNESFILLNTGVGRKIFQNNRGEVKLYIFDLLNQNTSIVRNITESYIEDVNNNVLQRYFMLSFKYDLRRMR